MDQALVLGVVQQDGPSPVVEYLNERVAATPDILAMAAPLKPGEVFRLAATCAEHKCPHFDGADCQLATRVVELLSSAVDSLPPCVIRKECRWYFQEGEAACKRCPEIVTISYDLSPQAREVSGWPVIEEPRDTAD
jgi:hypothetical protein